MRFPARELKPYGEYVRSKDLVVGEVYFRVQFLDNHMLVPEVAPCVFVGRNLFPGDQERTPSLLYFQDFDSYSAGVRYETTDSRSETRAGDQSPDELVDRPSFESEEESDYSDVCEFEKALDQLLECSLRRSPPSST